MLRWTLLLVTLAGAAGAAVDLELDLREVDEARALGQTRIAQERTRFHQPYRLVVAKPPVDYIEVVTPFRRIVLAAQARAAAGDRSFGQRQALEAAGAAGRIELYIELSFHPFNTYIGVPNHEVTLVSAGQRLPLPIAELRPRHGPRIEGMPIPVPVPGGAILTRQSEPLLGGTVIAVINGAMLKPDAAYEVVVAEGGKEIARTRLPLSALR